MGAKGPARSEGRRLGPSESRTAQVEALNYWEYIRVEELLSLQKGFDGDEGAVGNDECLFIVVHQIYELWFKLILRELTAVRNVFRQNPVPDVALSASVPIAPPRGHASSIKLHPSHFV